MASTSDHELLIDPTEMSSACAVRVLRAGAEVAAEAEVAVEMVRLPDRQAA